MELKLVGEEVTQYFNKDVVIAALRSQVAEMEHTRLLLQDQANDYRRALNDIAANVAVYPILREIGVTGLQVETNELIISLKEALNA